MPDNSTISSRSSVLLSQLCSEDRSSRRSSMPLTLQNTCIRHAYATCCDKLHCGNVTHTARTNIGMMDGKRRITSIGYKPFPPSPGDASNMIFPKPAPPRSSSPPRSVNRVLRTGEQVMEGNLMVRGLPSVIVPSPNNVGTREPVRALDAKSNRLPNNSSGEEPHLNVEEKRHQEQYMRGGSGEKKILRKAAPPIAGSLSLHNDGFYAQTRSDHQASSSSSSSGPARSRSSSPSIGNIPLPTPSADEIYGPFADVLAAIKASFEDPISGGDHSATSMESSGVSRRKPDVPELFLPLFGATNGREGISGGTPKAKCPKGSKGKVTPSPCVEDKAGSRSSRNSLSHAAGKISFGRIFSNAITKTPSIANFWSSSPLPSDTSRMVQARSFSFTPLHKPGITSKSEPRTRSGSLRKHPQVSTAPEVIHSVATVVEFCPSPLWQANDGDYSSSKKTFTGTPQIPQPSFSRSLGSEPLHPNLTDARQLLGPPSSRTIRFASSSLSSSPSRISPKKRQSLRHGGVTTILTGKKKKGTLTRSTQSFILPPLSFESFTAQEVVHYALIHKSSESKRKHVRAPTNHSVRSSSRRSNWATRLPKARSVTETRTSVWKTEKPLPPLPLYRIDSSAGTSIPSILGPGKLELPLSNDAGAKGAIGDEAVTEERFVVNFGPDLVLDLGSRESSTSIPEIGRKLRALRRSV